MYLTRSAEYALRLVLELASRGPGARITSAELACSEKIPPAYAEKVVWARSPDRPSVVSSRKPTLLGPSRSSLVVKPRTGKPAFLRIERRPRATVVLPTPGLPSRSTLRQ